LAAMTAKMTAKTTNGFLNRLRAWRIQAGRAFKRTIKQGLDLAGNLATGAISVVGSIAQPPATPPICRGPSMRSAVWFMFVRLTENKARRGR
jgi:hypothetical protein